MKILLTMCVCLAVYGLLILLGRKEGQAEDAVSRRMNAIEKKGSSAYRDQRAEELEKPFYDRTIRPMLEGLGRRIKKIPVYFGNNRDDTLKLQLQQAGSMMNVTEYTALRVGITVVSTILSVLFVVSSKAPLTSRLTYLLLGIAGPYIVMRYLLAAKIKQRQQEIERQLPDVLDLMSVSVEAGLGFEQAMNYIMNNMEGAMVDEIAITYREISMGRSRRSAFVLMGERCAGESVKSFTNALVQATDLGISMKVLLQAQADAMRLHRKRVVEEKAMKVSTKLLFPLVFFIFPVIFIVLLGPALMNIFTTL
ncbi:MAG: type II secretion system F family protein [Lachnospiraceae bacterium]